MIRVEKLSNDNFKDFSNLLEEAKSKNEYLRDFFRFYDNKSFIFRYIVRKMVYIIKYNEIYIGYIWIESPSYESSKAADIYIKEEYIKYFTGKLLLILKTEIVTLECFENEYSRKILKALDMIPIRKTYLMKLENYKEEPIKLSENLSFSIYKKRKDALARCNVQNKIFFSNARVPLNIEDIYYDEKQDYFLDNLSLFLKYGEKEIGYGQIIYSGNMNLIVNFGIIEEYRGKGYGRLLINKLIQLAFKNNIKDLYIRVDTNNKAALNLYEDMGFKTIGNFLVWMWAKDTNFQKMV
ncbi:Acetyltransferase (GNAT) family protein [Clostridium sp. DSM 8431]|uniref:GNAT family N-acetyltransferase n=1 Tax=Clostridium sp. DSM 8431 TaxID=1761781 RepID=UPI0008F2AC82|nr:GNAT family N-acetyltransferase [Clostridium sp. DSM 8431]SFU42159.1 Acetyltransferase (GNAT) family protein [Clostridium sp. DSM 8431]